MSVASPRRTFSILWNGSNYANVKPRLHPSPCLRIWGNETSVHKQASHPNWKLHMHTPPTNAPKEDACSQCFTGLKDGKKKKKKKKKEKIYQPTERQHRPLPADGNGTPLVHCRSIPGKGHRDAIYRALLRSEVFKKCFSSAQQKHFKSRGRVNKAISCADPPPRSLDVMADLCCTGQTL